MQLQLLYDVLVTIKYLIWPGTNSHLLYEKEIHFCSTAISISLNVLFVFIMFVLLSNI